MAEVIGRELDLVAVDAENGWFSDDASIVQEDVESVVLVAFRDSVFNGAERGQVHLDENHPNSWVLVIDLGDESVGSLGIAAGEVDVGWVVGSEGYD